MSTDTITLAHGGGGRAMHDLVSKVFVDAFYNPCMGCLEDQARLSVPNHLKDGQIAFTTDGFVVDPLFFPGGDIGTLAVNGTVNDLAVGGAVPLWISCAFIIEEGTDLDTLRRIACSMRRAADAAHVQIVTGDTKVVGRGSADKVFITTSGVGMIPRGTCLEARHVQVGDVAIVSGYLGDHGAAVMTARGDMALDSPVLSDSAPLAELMHDVVNAAPHVRCARDCTRGGLASVLNEIAASCRLGIEIDEDAIPRRPEVRGLCEILGLDPLYLANEGALVLFVPAHEVDAALAAMRGTREGANATPIGRAVAAHPGTVVMNTLFGGSRIVDMLVGEQLPRIC